MFQFSQVTGQGSFVSNSSYVLASTEWQRIDAIPRRQWTDEEAEELADQLTEMLKTPTGTWRILPQQAICLREAWIAKGLWAAFGVSAGKTLLSFLLCVVLGAKNPVIVVPAKLSKSNKSKYDVGKTQKEWKELSAHFKLGVMPTIISYESLGVLTGKESLEALNPDLLVFDEIHKLRNPKAARTKRVHRFLKAHPDVTVCGMTGSTIKRAFSDYAHLIRWCLKENSPLPWSKEVIDEWDQALSEKLDCSINRIGAGALLRWCLPGEQQNLGELNAARRAVQRRISETPGAVCFYLNSTHIRTTIELRGIKTFEFPGYADSKIEEAFNCLRPGQDAEGNATGWELPDGQELVEGLEIFRHANEEALGFFSRWKHPAPKDWLEKRKAFNSFIRSNLAGSRKYDSPDEVAKAFPTAQAVIDWLAVKKSYEPETIIVWLDSGPLRWCADWLKDGGVAFTQHTKFGEALAQLAGVPYFGAGGLDANRKSIETFYGRACVASVYANGEGRNMHLRPHPLGGQTRIGFERMLITCMLRNGPEWEQVLGRLHRLGCLADVVKCDVLIGCKEHVYTFEQCLRDAELDKYSNGGEPKLLQAEIDMLTSDFLPSGLAAFR